MSHQPNATGAAARAADTLLRSVGGRRALLRMPAPATAADVTEQLGIATPEFQDISLEPVVFRKARALVTGSRTAKWEMLVSATTVKQIVGSLAGSATSPRLKQKSR